MRLMGLSIVAGLGFAACVQRVDALTTPPAPSSAIVERWRAIYAQCRGNLSVAGCRMEDAATLTVAEAIASLRIAPTTSNGTGVSSLGTGWSDLVFVSGEAAMRPLHTVPEAWEDAFTSGDGCNKCRWTSREQTGMTCTLAACSKPRGN